MNLGCASLGRVTSTHSVSYKMTQKCIIPVGMCYIAHIALVYGCLLSCIHPIYQNKDDSRNCVNIQNQDGKEITFKRLSEGKYTKENT